MVTAGGKLPGTVVVFLQKKERKKGSVFHAVGRTKLFKLPGFLTKE